MAAFANNARRDKISGILFSDNFFILYVFWVLIGCLNLHQTGPTHLYFREDGTFCLQELKDKEIFTKATITANKTTKTTLTPPPHHHTTITTTTTALPPPPPHHQPHPKSRYETTIHTYQLQVWLRSRTPITSIEKSTELNFIWCLSYFFPGLLKRQNQFDYFIEPFKCP